MKPRVCAVSFLNTVPLVSGMTRGPQQELFDVSFAVPSECADRVAEGSADIGIVPAVEVPALGLEIARGTGIACRGPVRSILLISKVPVSQIRTLAADTSSRTSVQLARVILQRKYGVVPHFIPRPPDVPTMLNIADAALVIGDTALRVEPSELPFEVLDLGAEWFELTGLPMVFAVWAGRPSVITSAVVQGFIDSYHHGLGRLEEIVREESVRRGMPETLVREYFTRHIIFELGEREYEGMRLFLQYVAEAKNLTDAGKLAV
ncbi:MAG: menaquinone biosynthesis protein [Bryobacteraceae bacterium]|nr:menaquinone biosynthesis protein [Bryobacteraceae bacterium]